MMLHFAELHVALGGLSQHGSVTEANFLDIFGIDLACSLQRDLSEFKSEFPVTYVVARPKTNNQMELSSTILINIAMVGARAYVTWFLIAANELNL